ncbi:MAG TPA: TIGR03435 family protein [Terriglobia bacterium]|jgi:uncharacterized protein (TIGR03435 family)
MKQAAIWSCICAAMVSLLLASPQKSTFDVATIKSTSGRLPNGAIRVGAAPIGHPAAASPGRLYYDRVSLKSILLVAFSLKEMQLVCPDWMASEYYEIDARMPVGTTPERIQTMLQNLLVERFKMTLHREVRETDAYRLVVAKGGPKLKEVEAPKSNVVIPPRGPVQRDADGWMIAPRRPGPFADDRSDRSRWTFQQSRVTELATALERRLNQPVTDATSLKGNYDFTLTFSADGLPTLLDPLGFPVAPPIGVVPQPLDLSNVFTALEQQIGLKLERTKGSIDELVIDQATKTPGSN